MSVYTDEEIDEFINRHVAHRLTVLMTLTVRMQDAAFFQGKGDLFCAAVEGNLIVLRGFTEFLGVQSTQDGKSLSQRSRTQRNVHATDVMLDNFGLPLVKPEDFGDDAALIARVSPSPNSGSQN